MEINKIVIKRFRSINEISICLNKITAIVGENNVGKSAVLRALNAFFNFEDELPHFRNGSHDYANNCIPKIQLTFTNVPLKPEFQTIKAPDGTMTIEMTYNSKSSSSKYKYKQGGRFVDLDEKIWREINKIIQFVYIPIKRDHSQTVIAEQTLLKKVIDKYLDNHTKKRDLLTPKLSDAIGFLNRNALQKVAKDVYKFYTHRNNFDINIEHYNKIDYRFLLEGLSIKLIEESKYFNLQDCGSGVQSLMNIALYRYYASLENIKIILGIEEPEINLHPQAQKEFIKRFKKNSENNEIQAIITTHSAAMVDQLEHTDLVLFRKVNDQNRSFKSEAFQLPSDFWNKHQLQQLKYYQFYHYRNSDFFYSKYVVIVESKTDGEIVKKLMLSKGIDLDDEGFSILNLEGIEFLKYPIYLLKYLKIPYLVIVDKDFFLEYSNNDKKSSRNVDGFFKYKYSNLKNSTVINELIPSQLERTALLKLFKSNHSKALDLLEKHSIICMNYNLEMDLISSGAAQKEYYKLYPKVSSTKDLLIEYESAIKKLENMTNILSVVQHKNLPHSYKRIKSILHKKIKKVN